MTGKNILYWLAKVMIAGALSLGILSVFTLVYYYNGMQIENRTGATDFTLKPGGIVTNLKEGFSFLKMDQNGFNNATFSDSQIDVLLMGSSHMEARYVFAEESTAYQLNKLFPELYTYNIGMQSHEIYTCVKNMEDAVRTYHPQRYVILEANSVELDTKSMQKVVGGGTSLCPPMMTAYYI